MTHDLWNMPGPRRFVDAAVRDVMDAGCVIVEVPERLHVGFAHAFAVAIQHQDVHVLRRLDVSDVTATPPGDQIARHSLPPGVSAGVSAARDLVVNPDLEYELLWVEGFTRSTWRSWDIFLRAFARERAVSRLAEPYALAIAVPPGMVNARDDVPVRRWTGALRRADTALFVAETMIGRETGLDPRVAEDIVTELTGWNLPLAKRFGTQPDDVLADPIPWLYDHIHLAPDVPVEEWNGRPFTCALTLAARNEHAVLRHRLWRAHLGSVFPILEEIRIDAAQRHQNRLARNLPWTTPWHETLHDPEQLELAHILNLIHDYLAADERERLVTCKRMRNQLAHRAPVDATDLRQIARQQV